MGHNAIILFDGVCNLCNASVQFVIKRDKKNYFKFASLQSDAGQKLLRQYELGSTNFDSFVLIMGNRAFKGSTAALKVSKELSGPIRLLYGFIIVPAFIRDAVYQLIANNRYKWFGKQESCMIPTAALREKFLS